MAVAITDRAPQASPHMLPARRRQYLLWTLILSVSVRVAIRLTVWKGEAPIIFFLFLLVLPHVEDVEVILSVRQEGIIQEEQSLART